MNLPEITIRLPGWIGSFLADSPALFPSLQDRMRLVVELSRWNVRRGTGGPFGAAVFDGTGRLVAPGVNIVVAAKCSVLHAEIVALCMAQRALGRYDIGEGGQSPYSLVSSTEPCAMCFGAVPWSGVGQLACGARDEDASAIGFDEGPKLPDWMDALNERGIEVVRDVLRDEAVAVLKDYHAGGGPIYNAGGPRSSSRKR